MDRTPKSADESGLTAKLYSESDLAQPNPKAEQVMSNLRDAIHRCYVNAEYSYQPDLLMDQKINWLARHCKYVLDVGQSSRSYSSLFESSQIITSDINQNTVSPVDIVDDICAPSRLGVEDYNAIICLSVLEHVYDPFSAMQNLHAMLKPNGYLFLHLPFLFRYHAEIDLEFADCYRFSRDGLAWMLRDFSEVTLYPVRGPYSSMFNLQKFWKKKVEKNLGMTLNRWLDLIGLKLFGRSTSELQVSGYYVWARK